MTCGKGIYMYCCGLGSTLIDQLVSSNGVRYNLPLYQLNISLHHWSHIAHIPFLWSVGDVTAPKNICIVITWQQHLYIAHLQGVSRQHVFFKRHGRVALLAG